MKTLAKTTTNRDGTEGSRMTTTRAPLQVAVIPFMRRPTVQYAVFKRKDLGYWQVLTGGKEEGETNLAAAQREAREEAGIAETSQFYRLKTMTMVPVRFFAASSYWPDDTYVIPQLYFAVAVDSADLRLSEEHTTYEWLDYERASRLLRWQSDQVALWELHERLRRGRLIAKEGICCDCDFPSESPA